VSAKSQLRSEAVRTPAGEGAGLFRDLARRSMLAEVAASSPRAPFFGAPTSASTLTSKTPSPNNPYLTATPLRAPGGYLSHSDCRYSVSGPFSCPVSTRRPYSFQFVLCHAL